MPADRQLAEKYGHYLELEEGPRRVCDTFVLAASFSNLYDRDSLSKAAGISLSDYERYIKEFETAGILTSNFGTSTVDPDLMVIVLPLIDPLYLKGVKLQSSYPMRWAVRLGMLLRTAIGEARDTPLPLNQRYHGTEYEDPRFSISLAGVLDCPHYDGVREHLDSQLLEEAAGDKLDNILTVYGNIRGTEGTSFADMSDVLLYERAYAGEFEGLMAHGRCDPDRLFAAASSIFLKEEDTTPAKDFFERGLTAARKLKKRTQIPTRPLWTVYYLCYLLSLPPEEHIPILEKISKSLEKSDSMTEIITSDICNAMLNKRNDVFGVNNFIMRNANNTPGDKAFTAIGGWMISGRMDNDVAEEAFRVAEQLNINGHKTLALELLYAVCRSGPSPDADDLYSEIREEVGFEPALSRFIRYEEWERDIDGMLALAREETGIKTEGASCIAYEVELRPSRTIVTPVILKRKAKGGWTTGRKANIKTLKAGSEPGMTEQDKVIATFLNPYSWEPSSEEGALEAMVGHPHIICNGVSAEFVAGTPEITISRTRDGYAVEAPNGMMVGRTMVTVETSTRYRISRLSEKMADKVKTLMNKPIRAPEAGADKLARLAEAWSPIATVHSDLERADGVTHIEADLRLRVQLMQFNDSIRAEILSKPFGGTPPYFRPGVGGRSVFCTRDGGSLRAVRDLEKEKENNDILLSDIQTIETAETEGGVISFRDPMDSLELLEVLRMHEDIAVPEWPEGAKFRLRASLTHADLDLSMISDNDWFDIDGKIRVDENLVLTIRELLSINVSGKGRFIELGNGEFIALERSLKRQLDQLYAVSDGDVRVSRFAMASIGDLIDSVDSVRDNPAWTELKKKMDKGSKDAEIPEGLTAELRPYQAEGFRWMARLASWGAGACLADDMGLGKTVQAICILLHRSKDAPSIVISPVSVIPNWLSELGRFAPSLNAVTLPPDGREEFLRSLHKGDVLVTSYGLLQSEEHAICSVAWSTAVLDEAHNIRNFATKTSKAAMSVKAGFRLALTGTPVQNNLTDAWSIFNFINPGMLGSLANFSGRFVSDGEEGRKHLKKLIAPFILRRTKSAVLDELPPKTEVFVKVSLSDEEAAFYEAVRQRAVESLEECADTSRNIQVLAEITRLRQASCNTRLVDPLSEIASSKMSAFMDLVRELTENGHRALVFSQFVTHLALAREELDREEIEYLYLDGSTPVNERGRLVKSFQSGEGSLFLISLKAGGLGLNLTGADFVIHLDPWWNPAVEDQASDRAHRIGQAKPVTVYRLVGEGTIEEKIIRLHATKRDMADMLLEGSDRTAKLSSKELMRLIRYV
jgi:superfamily II DNA or RNA helicase